MPGYMTDENAPAMESIEHPSPSTENSIVELLPILVPEPIVDILIIEPAPMVTLSPISLPSI